METQSAQQKMFIKAEAILKYLLGTNEQIETLIICKPNDVQLFTYDQSLYEAIGSLDPEEKQCLQRLTKFLESVDILSYSRTFKHPRVILKQERVDELRKLVSEPGANKQN